LGLREYKSIEGIESTHYFPSQLKMGKLVLTNRNDFPFIKGDICGHEDRITYQPIVDIIWLCPYFFLKRRHT